LVDLGADINTPNSDGYTPLHKAAEYGHDASIRALVNVGADVKQFLQNKWGNSQCSLLWNMLQEFVCGGGLSFDFYQFELFSLTKLMSSAEPIRDDHAALKSLETNIAISMRQKLSTVVIERMDTLCYVLKRRLVLIAWRVYESTLLADGERITVSVKAQRYMELVCFLYDLTMLGDVLSLRLTCKSNNERRRFPVCYVVYRKLEANLIEEWVAYGSSRFVSTDIICAVMAIHRSY
jgi:hypothetical protein